MLDLKANFGAVGDGVTDDTNSALAWVAGMISTGTEGYVPTGTYRMTQRLLFGLPGNLGNSVKFHGDGPYKSTFNLAGAPNTLPQIQFYTATQLPTSCYPIVSDVGFVSDTPNTLCAIGMPDFSDNVGNANLTNCFFSNQNSTASYNAKSLQLNYVFDSVFTNCVCISKVGYGEALNVSNAQFCSFYGGSYSNAHVGVRLTNQASMCLTFVSPDFENLNCGLASEIVGNLAMLINPFFDIWRPDLGQPGSAHAIYSVAGKVVVDMGAGYITPRSPQPLAGPAVGVEVRT